MCTAENQLGLVVTVPSNRNLPFHIQLHKKHHHKKSFCSGFHKLPFGARLAIFITVAAVGLAILMCCVHVFCCKQPRKSQKYDLAQFKDSFDTELDDEAPPLEQKKPLDEQKLVITA